MDLEKLQIWAKQIHENATAHGWHEKPMPDSHWLMMVITEVAEVVEADRKGKRANKELCGKPLSEYVDFEGFYEIVVKGTLEEEFSDVVIRILDFTYEKYGDRMDWNCIRYLARPFGGKHFTETAYRFVRSVLGGDMVSIADSVGFLFQWASIYEIDLDWHIEAKMLYNSTRPYKHGDKKY